MLFKLQARSYFSADHIQAAALFARASREIEHSDACITSEHIAEHRAYVTATIIQSVAYLESVINEFFSDAYEIKVNGQRIDCMRTLADGAVDALAAKWQSKKYDRKPALEKFEEALGLVRHLDLSKQSPTHDEVKTLINLRNALIHFKPGWSRGGEEVDTDPSKISKR